MAFEGREMANKTNEVLLHMQTQSNPIKLIRNYQKFHKSVAVFSDGCEVYEGSLFGYTLNCHII